MYCGTLLRQSYLYNNLIVYTYIILINTCPFLKMSIFPMVKPKIGLLIMTFCKHMMTF